MNMRVLIIFKDYKTVLKLNPIIRVKRKANKMVVQSRKASYYTYGSLITGGLSARGGGNAVGRKKRDRKQ